MYLARVAILALATGCALTPASLESSPSALLADVLPAPSGPLHLALDQDISLADVVADFAENTGQHIVMDGQTEGILNQRPIVIGGATDIPAEEVYEFVEGLLFFHDLFIAPVKGGERPVLGIYSGRRGRKAAWTDVAQEELHHFASHPALMVQTTIDLPNSDVRQISTSLRAMLTDTNTQLLLPMGESSLLVGGTGSDVAKLAGTLKRIDEASGRRSKARMDAKTSESESGSSR